MSPRYSRLTAALIAASLSAAAFAADTPAAKPAAKPAAAAPAKPSNQAVVANPGLVKTALSEQAAAEDAAKSAQARINTLDDQTRDVVSEYRATLQETESLKRYNQQLALQVKSQEEEMVSIQQQIIQIERTAREITPLLQKMLETLGQFVSLDVPFLPDERKNRVAQLNEMMTRADVTLSEKYRRIVEAYQVEMEYGRTLEAYQGKVGEKTVDFLRVGRVSFLYQTLDGSETAYWDAAKKEWVVDNSYDNYIAKGLKVAKKQGAPDLLIVPVSAPKESK